MYVPKHFAVDDLAELHAFIARHSFGTLVNVVDGVPFATHLPFLVQREGGAFGLLRAHLARANPHWRSFGSGEACAIFTGPHAYVTPSWYEEPEAVPTWNYTAVHAYGRPRIVEDRDAVRALLDALIDKHEASFAQPWSMRGLDEAYVGRMMNGIVAFEIPIARIEGKYKLSQNRPPEDRATVRNALRESDDPTERAVAAMMSATDPASR